MLRWWHNWKYHFVCGVSLNKICDNCSSNNSKGSPKRTHQPRIWSAGGTTNLWTMVTSAKTFYHRSEKPWFGRGIHFLESAISKSNPPPPSKALWNMRVMFGQCLLSCTRTASAQQPALLQNVVTQSSILWGVTDNTCSTYGTFIWYCNKWTMYLQIWVGKSVAHRRDKVSNADNNKCTALTNMCNSEIYFPFAVK